MLSRPYYHDRIQQALTRGPIAALLGPRQCGKSTLARAIAALHPGSFYLDLESPRDAAMLAEPQLLLEPLRGLVVLDEIQLRPDLFPLLRVLADRAGTPARFLLLGSASPLLIRMSSESLAGRIAFVEMSGFDLAESGAERLEDLWARGGFPRSFLAADDAASWDWRQDFIRTYLERDIPQLGINIPAPTMRRFWTMLAHYHGQIWNASQLSASMGLSDKTVRSHLDILTGTFMVRQLQPWFENLGKRQVKSPKIYLRDSGLLHALLGCPTAFDLRAHPKLGASWEGFALEQVIATLRPDEAYFWGTSNGAELDLLCFRQGKRLGFEFKYSSAPAMTRSMSIARDDLKLDHLYVIYPGDRPFPLKAGITAWPCQALASLKESL